MKTKPICLATLLLLCSGWARAAAPGKTYHFTILHTNDMHGRFWTDGDGELGLAAQKTLIDRIRAEVRKDGGYTLVLNAGDVNTGVPESDMQDAEPMFRAMNAIGYDAMALGNHEFDKPGSVLQKQKGWARFPMLSANLYAHGTRPFPPAASYRLGGLKVTVFGLITPDTPKLVDPKNVADDRFADPRAEAARLVPALRKRSDVVIALTHLGYYPDGRHGTMAAGDVELARDVRGIDVIVGGHSHTEVCMASPNVLESEHVPGAACQPDRQNGTWIMQAGEWGKYVGRADFSYRDGRLKLVRYTLIPVNLKHKVPGADGKPVKVVYGETLAQDPDMVKLLTPYQEKGQQALSVAVGRLEGVLDGARERVRRQPTSMGRFIASVMMQRTGADLALLNSGDVRDSLQPGSISYRDVLRVLPFGSTLVTVDMTGHELNDVLAVAARMSPGSGAYPQFAGVALTVKDGALLSAEVGGKPIDPARHYRLVTNSFVAAGGDGYPKLDRLPAFVDTGLVDADVLKAYFQTHDPVSAAAFEP
jgi:5'-nucleotidase / UDP-sugar diphosphatase